uniref:class A beta-lactamase, subclass A2 n=1 Tax=uncultured bacterium TaxID=77133 RepID=UPI0001F35CFC|nr:class A beta-lactamase, subclass A2 [uncultured bacterium]CBI71171.1 beta-lactamase class A [uncultured bacterium]
MKRIFPAYILLTAFLLACSSNATTQNANQSNKPAAAQEAKADDKQNRELQKQIEQIASAARGRVGVHAVVLETGESVSLDEQGRFPMQSVYKFPIGMAVLAQVDAGKLKLDERVRVEKSEYVREGMHSPLRDKNPNEAEVSVRELLRLAVSESDGTASDVLFRLAGGSEAITRYLSDLKVTEIIVADTEKEIGQDWDTQYRNWASPKGAVMLLRAFHEGRGLSAESRALLLKLMTDTPTGPKRLKGLLPKGTVVAHKTGTSGANASGISAATNDIGIVTLPNGRHLAIAVFVSDSPADLTTREGVIAKVAKAAWDQWGK